MPSDRRPAAARAPARALEDTPKASAPAGLKLRPDQLAEARAFVRDLRSTCAALRRIEPESEPHLALFEHAWQLALVASEASAQEGLKASPQPPSLRCD